MSNNKMPLPTLELGNDFWFLVNFSLLHWNGVSFRCWVKTANGGEWLVMIFMQRYVNVAVNYLIFFQETISPSFVVWTQVGWVTYYGSLAKGIREIDIQYPALEFAANCEGKRYYCVPWPQACKLFSPYSIQYSLGCCLRLLVSGNNCCTHHSGCNPSLWCA